ncbi:tetratricopeptide repeat protein [Mesorhizobium sp. ZMM04-5]|uniref:Tetratricopeptide repeat protein n=1 Tax=Mesorhizobium marinum TaxID=3228790 RepID=A0ABV3QWK8_9HYPH
MQRILASSEFRASTRRREMLQYLVEETLSGRAHALKGYAIGVSVFRRGEDFDAQSDPVVRLEARRLRRDLASYYVLEGRDNPLRISIPKGHYAPEFQRATPPAHQPGQAAPVGEASEPSGHESNPVALSAARQRSASVGRNVWLAAGAAAVVLLALLVGWIAVQPGPVADERVLADARGPSVMVFPLVAAGETEKDAALAEGLASQIVTELSRFSDFRLYLPPAGHGRDPEEDPLAIAKPLGVSFVLTGRVESDGATIKITSRLSDVATGRVIWVQDFDRAAAVESLLMLQNEVAGAISSALGQPYGIIKTQITNGLPDDFRPSMPSYECVLRAFSYRRSFSAKSHGPVFACLKAAVERDPQYADAWAMLGWLYLDAGRFNLTADAARAYDQGLDAASHAILLDGRNVLALTVLASIHHYMGNYAESEQFQRKALELNPNDPDVLAQLGWRLAARGRFDEGIPYLKQAIERTVNPPAWYYHFVAIDHYLHGRYVEMLDAAKTGAIGESGASWSFIAIAYGALGDKRAAKAALERMAEVAPRTARDPAAFYRLHGTIESTVQALVEGLRKAGWTGPEGS